MDYKERLKQYLEEDTIYSEYKSGKCDMSDFDKFCIEHCKDIECLLNENTELQLELSGYRQAILNDRQMLGLKEQNKKYKEVIDKTINTIFDNIEELKKGETNCFDCLRDAEIILDILKEVE